MEQNQKYTCFVISPLGQEGSPERMNADQVLDYLIIPTLTRCGFSKENIVRSDKIAEPGRISEHIASCIEASELCIIDLTGLNANVMYEYGLRKGYGKPYIVLAQKGQPLPFDVYDDRTIFYDISEVPALIAAQETLEKFTEAIKAKGFIESKGPESVTSIDCPIFVLDCPKK